MHRNLKKGDWQQATIDLAIENRKPNPKPDLRKTLFPLGPVVVFGASNFPLAYSTAGGDTISALAAGCPVIVKSHLMHAGTGELVARAIQKSSTQTNMPVGVFSNLNSNSYNLGKKLVTDSRIKAVGFTGSISGGTAITQLANDRIEPIPVFAEMGSVNPVIILPQILEGNPLAIVESLGNSIQLDAGQFCTNPGLIFLIKNEESDLFVQQLAKKLSESLPLPMLHPQLFKNYQSNKSYILEYASVNDILPQSQKKDITITPALASVPGNKFLSNPNFAKEVFGSFSLIVDCSTMDELINCINSLKGQLTGTINGTTEELTENKELIETLRQKVGRLIFNGVPTGVEVTQAMHHGGPFPATSNSFFTAVGPDAIKRWTRPVSFQNCPNQLLPDA